MFMFIQIIISNIIIQESLINQKFKTNFSDIEFVDGLIENSICYYSPSQKICDCVGSQIYKVIASLLTKSYPKSIQITKYNQALINKINQFQFSSLKKSEQIQDIKTIEEAKSIGTQSAQLSENRFCFLTMTKSLHCSGYSTAMNSLKSFGNHNCLIIPYSGKLSCWGSNKHRESVVPGLQSKKTQQVSLGLDHTCAISSTNKPTCWGLNDYHQLYIPRMSEDEVVIDISTGNQHTCFLYSTGQAECSGSNQFTQLDVPGQQSKNRQNSNSDSIDKLSAVTPPKNNTIIPSLKVTFITSGGNHSCLIDSAKSALCFGDNKFGQTDIPKTLTHPTLISAGSEHNCGINSSPSLVCWGSNLFSQSTVPTLSSPTTRVVSGGHHNCVMYHPDRLACWGRNEHSQAINRISTVIGAMAVSAGGEHTCAVSSGGRLNCWGRSDEGQTDLDGVQLPSQIAEHNVERYAIAGGDVCYKKGLQEEGNWSDIDDLNTVYCETTNGLVQLENVQGNKMCMFQSNLCIVSESNSIIRCQNYLMKESQYEIAASEEVKDLECGFEHACYLSSSGNIYCWSRNGDHHELPEEMSTQVKKFKVGYNLTCVTKDGNEIICDKYIRGMI